MRPPLTHIVQASALGLAVLLVGLNTPAQAAETDKAVARAHYEMATRLFELREYTKALDEYKAAYMAKPDPAFLFNIGQCYRKMGKRSEALDFFQQYLKKLPTDDPMREQVQARIRSLELGTDGEAETHDKADGRSEQKTVAVPLPAPLPRVPTPVPALPYAPSASSSPAPNQTDTLVLESSPPAANPAPRFYETWWFWTGIGAVVAAGVVSAIVLSPRGGGTDTPTTTLGTSPVFP